MKTRGYHAVIAELPRLMNAMAAADYCCTETMLDDLCAHFGLVPIEKRRGSTIYDRHDIDAAINRKKAANLEAAAC